MALDCELCHAHSGICKTVKVLEDDVKGLQVKWDNMQKLLVGSLVAGVFNLAGIIVILLTK